MPDTALLDRLTALIRAEYHAQIPAPRPTPRALAARLLDDTELLDAIVAYRQVPARRFTAGQLEAIQDAVLTVLSTHRVALWLETPQSTTTPYGSVHPEDAGHVARWVAETLNNITEEPTL